MKTTEVVYALISLAGAVVSSVLAYFISKSSAQREIEKMRIGWEREDSLSSDEEFTEMVIAVTRYISSKEKADEIVALEKINSLRSKELGELFFQLNLMQRIINIRDLDGQPDFQFLDECLSDAIKQRRKSKRRQKMCQRDKPDKKGFS